MKNMRLIFSIAMLAVVVVFIGCSHKNNSTDKVDESIPVALQKITLSAVAGSVQAGGYFTTDDEAMLSFKIGGILQTVFVKEGDKIKKGQLLASLDKTEISAQVAQAQLALQKAERDFNRVKALYSDSVATLAQYQDAKTGLEMAQQQLQIAKFNLSFADIRATSEGYILHKMVNPGQIVGPGMPVLQTNGAGNANWYLKIGVSDFEWSAISLGDAAEITTDLPGNAVISGKVVRKSEVVDLYSGTFSIDIKPEQSMKNSVASGMFGKARVHLAQKRNAWLIPYESILDGDGLTGFVFVTNDQKTSKKVRVHIQEITPAGAVISSGLEGCSYIITRGSAYLQDGSAISVIGEGSL